MKTELSKIVQNLEQGRVDETEAQALLLGLLGVSKSVFVKDIDGIRHLFPWQPRRPRRVKYLKK